MFPFFVVVLSALTGTLHPRPAVRTTLCGYTEGRSEIGEPVYFPVPTHPHHSHWFQCSLCLSLLWWFLNKPHLKTHAHTRHAHANAKINTHWCCRIQERRGIIKQKDWLTSAGVTCWCRTHTLFLPLTSVGISCWRRTHSQNLRQTLSLNVKQKEKETRTITRETESLRGNESRD